MGAPAAPGAGASERSQVQCSELEDGCSDEVRRRRTFWVVQISRILQRCLGTCAHGGAGIRGNKVDTQPTDNGIGVVSVQTVKGEAVVEKSRRLEEHLTSHLEVHLWPCLGYCLRGCQKLIERWAYGGGRHTASLPVTVRAGKRIWRLDSR